MKFVAPRNPVRPCQQLILTSVVILRPLIKAFGLMRIVQFKGKNVDIAPRGQIKRAVVRADKQRDPGMLFSVLAYVNRRVVAGAKFEITRVLLTSSKPSISRPPPRGFIRSSVKARLSRVKAVGHFTSAAASDPLNLSGPAFSYRAGFFERQPYFVAPSF
jgi:hypothetical protein